MKWKIQWPHKEQKSATLRLVAYCPITNCLSYSVAFCPQANYTDWATATCRRNLVSTFADGGVSRGKRGGAPTVVNDLSYILINYQYKKETVALLRKRATPTERPPQSVNYVCNECCMVSETGPHGH
jgi:hypothetical protein